MLATDESLRKRRPYTLRVGRGPYDHNWNDSRAWGNGHLHIPIHSNTAEWECGGVQTPSNNGTWGIYNRRVDGHVDQDSFNLALSLRTQMGPASPGTDDQICPDSGSGQCTNFDGLLELDLGQGITSGYLEQEMHTWSTGVNHLVGYPVWDQRLALAVNAFCFVWPWEC